VVPRDTPIYEGKTVFWPRIDDIEGETPYTYEKSGPVRSIRKYFPFHHYTARPGDHVHGDPSDFEGLAPRSKYWIDGVAPSDVCPPGEILNFGIRIGLKLAPADVKLFPLGIAMGFTFSPRILPFPLANGGLMFDGTAKFATNAPTAGNGGLMFNGVAYLVTNVPRIGNGGLMFDGTPVVVTNAPVIGNGGFRFNGMSLIITNFPTIGDGGIKLDGHVPITDNLPIIGDGGIKLDGHVPITDNLPVIGDGGVMLDGDSVPHDNLPIIGDGGLKVDGDAVPKDNLPKVGDGGLKLDGTSPDIDNVPSIGEGGVRFDGKSSDITNVPASMGGGVKFDGTTKVSLNQPHIGNGGTPLDGTTDFSDNVVSIGNGGLMFDGTATLVISPPRTGNGGLMFNGSADRHPAPLVGLIGGIQMNFAINLNFSPGLVGHGGLMFNGSANLVFGNIADRIVRFPLNWASSAGAEVNTISLPVSGVQAGLVVANVGFFYPPGTGWSADVKYNGVSMSFGGGAGNGDDGSGHLCAAFTFWIPVSAGTASIMVIVSGQPVALQIVVSNIIGLASNASDGTAGGAASAPPPPLSADTGVLGPTAGPASYLNGCAALIAGTDTPTGAYFRGQTVTDTWSGLSVETVEIWQIVVGSVNYDAGIAGAPAGWAIGGSAFN
jgi:hypothetical protein